MRFCRENGISVFGEMAEILSPDTHYNERGNRIAAEFLYAALEGRGYLRNRLFNESLSADLKGAPGAWDGHEWRRENDAHRE